MFSLEILLLLPLALPGIGILIALTMIDHGGEVQYLAKAKFFKAISSMLFFGYLGGWWIIFAPPGLRFETEEASRVIGVILLFFAGGYFTSAVKWFQEWRNSD